MKRFILLITLFFVIIFIIDRAAGYTFAYMSENSKGGHTKRCHQITDKSSEDILIFGSSRANHHYNPQILTDSLHLSALNCGLDGNGIILFYGWWQQIKQHHYPKVIIYDINPRFDLLAGEDNHKFLGSLKTSYDRTNISSIFDDIDPMEKYKMLSQMYRYNSNFIVTAVNFLHPRQLYNTNGYMPLEGEVNMMQIRKDDKGKDAKQIQIDLLKISYLNKLIDEADGVQLIFAVSPIWYGFSAEELQPIKDICRERNIPFIDFSNNPKYVHNNDLFKDGTHLNSRGADEYTKDFIAELKRRDLINTQ